MKAKVFDQKFDECEDILKALDSSKAKRPMQEQKRVNVDSPNWMVTRLNREARWLGVSRQSIIKGWLSERLEETASNKSLKKGTL